MDRFQAMSVFVAVAEAESFARAARKLGLSPPSTTRAVAELEATVGAKLLHRTTRSVTTTETGARYLADCRRLLADLVRVEVRLSRVEGPGAVVASLAHAVGVVVGLIGVRRRDAVVADVAVSVRVGVVLPGVRNIGAVVAVVPDGVRVRVVR